MTEKLIAVKGMTYAGKWIDADGPFEASARDARVLLAIKRATLPKPPERVEPEPVKPAEKPAEPVVETPAEVPEPVVESKDLTAEDKPDPKAVGSVKGTYGRKDLRAK